MAIAVDRWNFIVHSGREKSKKIWLYTSLVLVWFLAITISIPSFIVNDEKTFQLKESKDILYKICEETWEKQSSKYAYFLVVVSFQFILPVLIVGSTNYRICNYLHLNVPNISKKYSSRGDDFSIKSSSEISGQSQKRVLINFGWTSYFIEKLNSARNERFSRSKKILFLVFLTFSVCWLPITILNIILDFFKIIDFTSILNGTGLSTLILFLHSFAMLSTCLNPVIYGLLNKNFKQEFIKIFKQILPIKQRNLEMVRESQSMSLGINRNQPNTNSKNRLIS